MILSLFDKNTCREIPIVEMKFLVEKDKRSKKKKSKIDKITAVGSFLLK